MAPAARTRCTPIAVFQVAASLPWPCIYLAVVDKSLTRLSHPSPETRNGSNQTLSRASACAPPSVFNGLRADTFLSSAYPLDVSYQDRSLRRQHVFIEQVLSRSPARGHPSYSSHRPTDDRLVAGDPAAAGRYGHGNVELG